MRGEFVALDLETTGLDPEQDAIIEFGAVRMQDGEIVDEYSTLVNPGRPIPDYVKTLTGIRDEDFLAKPHNPGEPPQRPAPTIAEALPAIRTFVGDAPIVGHNVGFDLSFLYRQFIFQNNFWVDTYDLASILLPSAPRYSLGSLTHQLGIELEDAHRALNDARASALLYWALWQKALELPHTTLSEIRAASEGLDWNGRVFFEAVLQEQRTQGRSMTPVRPITSKPLPEMRIPLEGHEVSTNIPVEAVTQLFNEKLPQHLTGYEARSQQAEMAVKVMEAFNQNRHVMIEAGTGTGKSLAYLIPSTLWATSHNERVVISTNTINLQEQLLLKDIPALRPAMGVPFEAVVLKGRGNYLCPRRLMALRRRTPQLDEVRVMAKILVWQLESDSGDKSEINLRGPIENNIWQRLSAEDEGCALERCEGAMEGTCPFYRARKAAESAHLVIVNHALLVSDALSENQVLPDYRRLVIDEAQHMEEAVTHGVSFRIDEITLRRRLTDIGDLKHGLLGEIQDLLRSSSSEVEFSRLSGFLKDVSTAVGAMDTHVKTLFRALNGFYYDVNGSGAETIPQLRITVQLQAKTSFAPIPEAWSVVKEFCEGVREALNRLAGVLLRREATHHTLTYDDLLHSTRAAIHFLDTVQQEFNAFVKSPDSNRIYWLSTGQNNLLLLHSAPLHVGTMVEKYLWPNKDTVVMTSATLQTADGFDYLRERLGASDFETLNVGSPFDYHKSTLVFVPEDMPDPNDRLHYQQAVERGLIELAAALDGRVMVLFTSYTQLRQTAQAITPRLALGNISVYDQSEGVSRQNLLEGFKSTEKAVLLGTRSFWEGVDIPGDAVSALVITRLPFAVPTEPIFAARSETYNDPFKEYAVPEAILRFRQGFGRLIRNQTDRGVVAIFDKRIISKSYGASFLESLPDCTVQYGKLETLPEITVDWIDRLH